VYYYSSNLNLQWERGGISRYFYPNTSISKIIDLIRPVDEWAEIAFLARQNAENVHCETLKEQVHKLGFHY